MGLEIKSIKDSTTRPSSAALKTTEIVLVFTDWQLTTCFLACVSIERLPRVACGTDLNSSSWHIELNLLEICHHHQQHKLFCITEGITTKCEELQEKRGTTNHAQVELLYSGSEFNHFKSATCDKLSDLVPRLTLKSCMLDPIPASVLKNCYDLLLLFITKVVNCSLQNSTLTSDMKRAIVRPSLKKPSQDYCYDI